MDAPLRLVVVGGGGFGREVVDVIEAINGIAPTFELLGFLDDGGDPAGLVGARGYAVLGDTRGLASIDAAAVVAITDPGVRSRLDRVAALDRLVPVLIHPAATVGGRCQLAPGVIVAAGARLTTNITVGRQSHIHVNAAIGHDTSIGEYASVFPGATVSGNVTLGDRCIVGTGANVIQGISVGEGTVIGAGAVVVDDLPPNVTAVGVPARPLASRH